MNAPSIAGPPIARTTDHSTLLFSSAVIVEKPEPITEMIRFVPAANSGSTPKNVSIGRRITPSAIPTVPPVNPINSEPAAIKPSCQYSKPVSRPKIISDPRKHLCRLTWTKQSPAWDTNRRRHPRDSQAIALSRGGTDASAALQA